MHPINDRQSPPSSVSTAGEHATHPALGLNWIAVTVLFEAISLT
jgi:hypothetical protein